MDGLVFIIIALVFVFKDMNTATVDVNEEQVVEDTTRVAKLNETYYDDQHAFSEIINALGFPRGRGDT